MKRARGVCSRPGCVEAPVRAGRCAEHATPAWAGSSERRAALGVPTSSVRQRLREQVRRRARNRCERCGAFPRPGDALFVVDHVVPVGEGGHPTSMSNLELVCPACDERKTRDDLERMRSTTTE